MPDYKELMIHHVIQKNNLPYENNMKCLK